MLEILSDLERSIDFYTNIFGMTELYRMALDTVTIVFLGYADSAYADTTMWKREGVLELVCPKANLPLPSREYMAANM